jgi:hypothetical protein
MALIGNLKGVKGDTGDQGPQGQPGSNGTNGTNGATWFTGAGVPSNALGVDDDLYLNTTSGDIYKKAGGSWV